MPAQDEALLAVEALAPVDGRYRKLTAPLRELLSEAGLIRERVRVEALWFLELTRVVPGLVGQGVPEAVIARARTLALQPDADCAAEVKRLESTINHDVKAVEYYLRGELAQAGAAAPLLELVHFGATSDDVNNLAYARLLAAARTRMLVVLAARRETLAALAQRYAALPMLARTHGQPASPTTLGKELGNIVARLERARRRWSSVSLLGKWNGAVGNFNAHHAALPAVDWPAVCRGFVESQGLEYNPFTTQIEPHDCIAEYCDALAALDVVLLDACRDFWGYISIGYLRQRAVAGEVGSSTMPHKVNPIDFENAEGNLGVANALLRHFAEKLPVSRWQRDLTDSTVLRNLGVALGHALIAWESLGRGLAKVAADEERIAVDLDGAWEVLAEAVQTVLRAHGIPNGYERLKEFSRGRRIDAASLAELIDSLPIEAGERTRLKALRPAGYIGLAAQLAREAAGEQT